MGNNPPDPEVSSSRLNVLDELRDLVGGLLDFCVVSLATRGVGVPQPQACGYILVRYSSDNRHRAKQQQLGALTLISVTS